MTVRHKFVYAKNQPFRTPDSGGIMVIERCSRIHETVGTHECPAVRITTYTEGSERNIRQLEAAEMSEWLKY